MKALLCAVILLAASAATAADLTGTWNLSFETPNGPASPTVDLKQDGNKLTGTYKGRLGESKVEGTADDKSLKFQVKLSLQGNEFTINFNGTIQGDGTLKGKVDFSGQGEADWTGKRASGAAPSAGAKAAAGAVNVTGKWDFTVETSAGAGSPKFEFKQDGEKLTGTYSGQLGNANLAGAVKDRAIEFKFNVDVGGNAGTVVYKGTIEQDGTIKGKLDLAGMAEGTFTGKRAK